ncbi:MAG: glycosyltransferase, partial [Aeromicrobium sp.]
VLRAVESQPQAGRIYRLIVPWLGFPSQTYGYVRDHRAAGSTKYPLSRLMRLAWDSITAFSAAPLRLATWIGGLTVIACLGLIVAVFVAEEAGETVPGWASTMIMVMGIGAVQLICLGLLGEYIARIFTTVQARPPFSIGYDSEEQDRRDTLTADEREPEVKPPAMT